MLYTFSSSYWDWIFIVFEVISLLVLLKYSCLRRVPAETAQRAVLSAEVYLLVLLGMCVVRCCSFHLVFFRFCSLKQHNGELVGGAKASTAGRPWTCACLIQGFMDKSKGNYTNLRVLERSLNNICSLGAANLLSFYGGIILYEHKSAVLFLILLVQWIFYMYCFISIHSCVQAALRWSLVEMCIWGIKCFNKCSIIFLTVLLF